MHVASLIDTTNKKTPPLDLYKSLINNDALPPNSGRQDIFRASPIDSSESNKKKFNKFLRNVVKKNHPLLLLGV